MPLPKGEVHKKKEVVQDVTLHDLDVANARPPGACVGGYGIGWLDWEGTGRLTRMLLFVL